MGDFKNFFSLNSASKYSNKYNFSILITDEKNMFKNKITCIQKMKALI